MRCIFVSLDDIEDGEQFVDLWVGSCPPEWCDKDETYYLPAKEAGMRECMHVTDQVALRFAIMMFDISPELLKGPKAIVRIPISEPEAVK